MKMFHSVLRDLKLLVRPVFNNTLHTRSFTKIVITDDETTIVALHPEQEFPYELSRPLPAEKQVEEKTVLKMSDVNEAKRVFKSLSPDVAREELCRLTLTSKHRWFPRARDKKAKKTPMNRPYL